jgi:hypothetical protein
MDVSKGRDGIRMKSLLRSGKFSVLPHGKDSVQGIQKENDVRGETTFRLTAPENRDYRRPNKLLPYAKIQPHVAYCWQHSGFLRSSH